MDLLNKTIAALRRKVIARGARQVRNGETGYFVDRFASEGRAAQTHDELRRENPNDHSRGGTEAGYRRGPRGTRMR